MSLVTYTQHGPVALAQMDDGKVNAFSMELIDGLLESIDRAEADGDTGALVIAGREGKFSAGFDLSVIQSGDGEAIKSLVANGGRAVRRAYESGVPIVAACTGHAVAAGALLLLGCDLRIGPDTDRIKVGLNEVAISLTLPDWALAIAAERLSRRHLQSSVALAQLHSGRGGVDAGFLDEVVAPEEVVPTALAKAAVLADTLDKASYARTVAALRAPVLEAMS